MVFKSLHENFWGILLYKGVYIEYHNKMSILTQQDAKKWVIYDPQTGIFKRRKTPNAKYPNAKIGYNSGKGYIRIEIEDKPYRAHRLAWLYMTGEWPKKQIDHINRIRSDNRFCNLREATARVNRINNGGKGYYFNKQRYKWVVDIRRRGKIIFLGAYNTELSAAYKAFIVREKDFKREKSISRT